ncbi:dimethyladenosine transferase [Clostridium argentinense CDC 2741]|uniref:Ribosomal RNA small subunit methyltransferase A n=1 Tax=Clostridium argentinense CDC 2741 TaxID=1418104 RepID=A0A0C1R477_9CLOT|nr:16S rRNA (adenine(1518)-N(6)/adenine(1519)-N(6))-dimethyltransferase RsmA [Clostridium argentinense]ARC86891.1 16S rRNA (adenine(1518)-N(6)/adenine(1519)-N(6))-dimethyltransferase [Clostridium argentinense]KIE45306.1 dimethyladenosine transferase [Clostridium argentinense CDC 2741]NFF40979.1 16S rRNA (adenine(1518)-N(6)/adenine(1519)-N(6))-dimethyltransferase RsmA [Clostridium argentinense]NFP51522.1 16S rRNA (adenine(1518)-N(6)/adenine(1519)-N(6))-dimethyltransferase RsmA [Clostridium argen
MENLTTKDIVNKYGFKFTKSLGQNFLTDNNVLKDIVYGAEVSKEDYVIEIGPGVGTLTKELLKEAKKVASIELDDKLIPILQEELKEYDNFELIHKDALKVNYNELIGDEKSVKVVANLPYYVTTPIIVNLLNGDYNFKSLTIMIQKEVAERIDAEHSTKEYGAFSLLVQYYCNTKIIRRVPPSCFIPSPKVDSIVIRLDKLDKPPVDVEDEKLFFNIIRQAFNMRRKTLWNGMKNLGMDKEKLQRAFEKAGIDPNRRGETLSIQEFATLSNNILEEKKN